LYSGRGISLLYGDGYRCTRHRELFPPERGSDRPRQTRIRLRIRTGLVLRYNVAVMTTDRRTFLAAALGAAASMPLRGQQPAQTPAPRDWTGQTPVRYPDPDIVAVDNRFRKYIVGNTPMKRLYTGTLWAEGPAWNGVGRYLVWSDIPNNVQMRWVEEDARVTVFHNPAGYSNANTFDFEGRQLSCEHGNRRV